MYDYRPDLEMFHAHVKPLLASMATLVTLYTDGWDTAVGTFRRTRRWIDADMHGLYDHYAVLVDEIKQQYATNEEPTL